MSRPRARILRHRRIARSRGPAAAAASCRHMMSSGAQQVRRRRIATLLRRTHHMGCRHTTMAHRTTGCPLTMSMARLRITVARRRSGCRRIFTGRRITTGRRLTPRRRTPRRRMARCITMAGTTADGTDGTLVARRSPAPGLMAARRLSARRRRHPSRRRTTRPATAFPRWPTAAMAPCGAAAAASSAPRPPGLRTLGVAPAPQPARRRFGSRSRCCSGTRRWSGRSGSGSTWSGRSSGAASVASTRQTAKPAPPTKQPGWGRAANSVPTFSWRQCWWQQSSNGFLSAGRRIKVLGGPCWN
jgi:hypothetical protein